MNHYDIIIRPILSECAFGGIKDKEYTFEVHKDATKPQIRLAVETTFKVKVASVNTMNYDGKTKRQGRHEGKTPAWKKAVVKLTDDSKAIEFFEGLQ